MLVGVVAFSFATGSLSSIISNLDSSKAKLQKKIETLDELKRVYKFNTTLYDEIMRTIRFDHSKNIKQTEGFMNELPYRLKVDLSYYIFKRHCEDIPWLYSIKKKHRKDFIADIGPRFQPKLVRIGGYIYEEGDPVNEIYFLTKGFAGFVIPKYNDMVIVTLTKGDNFGIMDLISNQEDFAMAKRVFTVKAL